MYGENFRLRSWRNFLRTGRASEANKEVIIWLFIFNLTVKKLIATPKPAEYTLSEKKKSAT